MRPRHMEEPVKNGFTATTQNHDLPTSLLLQVFLIGSQGNRRKKKIRISNFAVAIIFLFI